MVCVYKPDGPAQLALVESILIANGVPYFVHGRHMSGFFPGIQIGSYNVCTVMVPLEAAEDAAEILREAFNAEVVPDAIDDVADVPEKVEVPKETHREAQSRPPPYIELILRVWLGMILVFFALWVLNRVFTFFG
ncbi:MAG: DUF2007 domain-containing protein [Azoarcus sp.]|nr:DUF2007 domain-containing protein [Azoarcus sp.]